MSLDSCSALFKSFRWTVCVLFLALPAAADRRGTSAAGRQTRARTSRYSGSASSTDARPAGPAARIEKASLEIPGLKSQENAAAVAAVLERLRGVRSAVVDVNTRLAVVDYNPGLTEMTRFLIACRAAGFDASEYRVELRFPKPIKLKGG